jgi:hypothetical protein
VYSLQNMYTATSQAPVGFALVRSIIKRWLDSVTVDKISILCSSYQSTLLKQIPDENLPTNFGGTCRGYELSDEGPWQDPKWLTPQSDTPVSTGVNERGSTSIAVEASGEGNIMHAM